jgi:hypothetical protein
MAISEEASARETVKTVLRVEGLRTTRFSDVCGGTDELKRLLTEEPALAATPRGRQVLRDLVDDGMYMLARMEVRLREYQAFRDTLERLVQQMRQIEEPRLEDAAREAEQIRRLLARDGPLPAEEIVERAEAIRQVANDTEGALRRHKEAAIAAGRAYLWLKGARGWEDGSRAFPAPPTGESADGPAVRARPGAPPSRRSPRRGAGEAGPAAGSSITDQGSAALGATDGKAEPLPPWIPEAWLPPSPHREVIVDWLKRGRAVLVSEADAAAFPPGPQGREPLVQFEDGGVMPLRVVRWSEEVRNFYPLGQPPHPRGRLYRRREAGPRQPPQPPQPSAAGA